MSQAPANSFRLTLPLLSLPRENLPSWQGLQPVAPLAENTDGPEPVQPQGAYQPQLSEEPLSIPLVQEGTGKAGAELLAPAGNLEAAYAAFYFGADAIYLGLKKFSARAEAENFTISELEEINAYAHGLEPPRRVFVTINTVIRQDELPELIETLAALDDMGVDAVILQDLGVYRALRQFFPKLELHGSTQMAVHNRAGAEVLKRLGFRRVILARELTFEEVHDITATANIETEVFIHGALCFSYSGLCLFSAQTLGRSGNRGRCAYSCRDSFTVEGAPMTLRDGSQVKRDPHQGFPFSMKDLALPDHIPALRAAGVNSFKVEGRKKSHLYVATTTDYYRKLLDGTLDADHRPELESDLQTVFSRPWTRLFVQSNKDKEVADRDTVGHRGTPIGAVEAIIGRSSQERTRAGERKLARLRFRTIRSLERHDGLQIDLPTQGKPFGFAIDRLWIVGGKKHEQFQAPAGALVEVALPEDYPTIPLGSPVYCSSSQAVKQRYRFPRPKPGLYHTQYPLTLHVELSRENLLVKAHLPAPGQQSQLEINQQLPGPFSPAQDAGAMDVAVRSTFQRLGQTPFALRELIFHNAENLFVPISRLNQLRRELLDDLAKLRSEEKNRWVTELINATVKAVPEPKNHFGTPEKYAFGWSIKVDRIHFLDAFEDQDWAGIDEVIVDITGDHPTLLREKLDRLAERIGKDHIRLALPLLTRKWEEKGILHKLHHLFEAGWHKWEAGNLSAWDYLERLAVPISATPGQTPGIDLATDWSIYVVNRLAALQLNEMGVSRFALSPEDGLVNMRSLLAEFGPRAVVIVHQDTPLFLAESCAYANLIGGCPGKANCRFESMEMVSSYGEKVTALDNHCRTIVLNQGPFCLSTRLPDLARAGATLLRADFIFRKYDPQEVRTRWRLLHAGQKIPGGHAANFDRGIQ